MRVTEPDPRPGVAAVGLGVSLVALALMSSAAGGSEQPLDSQPSVIFSAGVFALVEKFDYPYSIGAALYARPTEKWRLVPGGGVALGPDGMAYVYLDLRRDFSLGKRWYCTPSLAGGAFRNGDEIGTGADLEFQTGISFSREFDGGLRLGLSGLHISNAGLSHPNNGTESIVLFLQLPL